MKALAAIGIGLALAMVLSKAKAATDEGAGVYYSDSGEAFDVSNADANVAALAALVRRAEAQDRYDAIYGGGTFTNFADHPAVTGEWPGVRLTSGPNAGKLTTAAGGYQITRTTWSGLGGSARFGDFSPAAQDAAFLAILEEKRPRALTLIRAGKFNDALAELRGEWEAFDKMIAGTYPITLAQAQDIYTANGGAVV